MLAKEDDEKLTSWEDHFGGKHKVWTFLGHPLSKYERLEHFRVVATAARKGLGAPARHTCRARKPSGFSAGVAGQGFEWAWLRYQRNYMPSPFFFLFLFFLFM